MGGGGVSLPCGWSCERLEAGRCLVWVSTLSPRQLRAFPRTAVDRRRRSDHDLMSFHVCADESSKDPREFTVGKAIRCDGVTVSVSLGGDLSGPTPDINVRGTWNMFSSHMSLRVLILWVNSGGQEAMSGA